MELSRIILRMCTLICLSSLVEDSIACQPQVCRRRRAVLDGTVKLRLDGCSGRSPPWTRQVAYCLDLSLPSMTLQIKDWYEEEYKSCASEGCKDYVSGTRTELAIDNCVQCWKEKARDAKFISDRISNFTRVEVCMDKFIAPFLNKDLPTFDFENRFKTINLADVRPAEYWWSVTVKLPCKPKTFVYWNAYCANSFAKNLSPSEYVLVQNHLIAANEISFYVEFGEKCSFEPEEIDIIWDESFPAPALAQLSSFPSQVPPPENEDVTIFFDPAAASRLIHTDGELPDEFRYARQAAKKLRQKRAVNTRNIRKLGVLFPCDVREFAMIDANERAYGISGAGKTFLIDTDPFGLGLHPEMLNFTLNFGYNETGCLFDSGEAKIVPNPPSNWLSKDKTKRKPSRPPKREDGRVTCVTCVNMQTDLDCLYSGYKILCAKDEVCQTEVRQITKDLKMISKTCKQQQACGTHSYDPNNDQCKPGKAGSVCRCCCRRPLCNAKANPCSI